MNKKMMWLGGVAVVLGLIWAGIYNTLVTKNESVKKSWGQVENVCQRRLDLIPNLVEIVKGYASHEKSVLAEVTELRSRIGQINLKDAAMNPEIQRQFMEAQGQLTNALSRLLVVVEGYPTLKADENFSKLQDELAGTENRVAVERKRYQDAVEELNVSIAHFPSSFVARIHGFKTVEYFKSDNGASKAPIIKF